jgi:hypothetical protein
MMTASDRMRVRLPRSATEILGLDSEKRRDDFVGQPLASRVNVYARKGDAVIVGTRDDVRLFAERMGSAIGWVNTRAGRACEALAYAIRRQTRIATPTRPAAGADRPEGA